MSTNEDRVLNGRPQSTIAQNFSASLNETFAIDNNPKLEGLLYSVEQKKQAVTSQSQELEALDAKLRETEARLNQKQKQSGTGSHVGRIAESSSTQGRKPAAATFSGQGDDWLPAGGGTSSAAHNSAPGQASPHGYSRWEGLLPQGSDGRGR